MSLTLSPVEFREDDEVFIGPMSKKEVLVRLFGNQQPSMAINHRNTISCDSVAKDEKIDLDQSVQIITAHSTPNILHTNNENNSPLSAVKADSTPNIMCKTAMVDLTPNDSFLMLEKMIENCTTLEDTLQPEVPKIMEGHSRNVLKLQDTEKQHTTLPRAIVTPRKASQPQPKIAPVTPKLKQDPYSTPHKQIKPNTPTFKTPCPPHSVPHSQNKQYSTPLKKQFQHVCSPVAFYINNSPVVPLIKNVRPSKPLPGQSSIPKLVTKKTIVQKENIHLPSVAYQSAKETKVIKFPDDRKLPENQWAKQVASSIPRRLVMKHVHRENGCHEKPVQSHNDSYQNLSLHRADLSICTQKSAGKYHNCN